MLAFVKFIGERVMTVFVLNSPVLTTTGTFRLMPLDIPTARSLVQGGFISAIGHEGSATYIGCLLECRVPVQRIDVRMQPGDAAVVLRLLRRLPEGCVLDHGALAHWPHEVALLERTA